MNFRLTTMLYLFALVAAGLAAFGAVGCMVAVVGVLMFWSGWFHFSRAGTVGVVLLMALVLLLLPAESRVGEASPSNSCLFNIKHLALTIHNYHDVLGKLPPANGKAGKWKAPQSWRVNILPFMEGQTISNHYNFDEPWNGPTNAKQIMPIRFPACECPVHAAPTHTDYFAITGPNTVWGNGQPCSFDDVADDPANTILLIELANRGVHWSEPKDLTFDEAVQLLTTPLPNDASDGHRIDRGYFNSPVYVRHVGMCDGSCRQLVMPLDREVAVALLTASGGEQVDVRQFEVQPIPQLAHGHPIAIGAFVLLALLPGVPKLRPLVWPSSEPEPAANDE
ncbi:DUF1559 domain-containing protein [Aeoliella sp.]|uniref:DUF1559 family PulG-like putative transporter n=1 Tax=Aeoliella sp. TaxID=2795800 RepID=UPI003CCB764D